MRRAITLEGMGRTLELSKVTAALLPRKVIHFDELVDSTWRLTFSKDLIPDFTAVIRLALKDKAVVVEGTDAAFQLSKTIAVRDGPGMLHLEETKGGAWRMLYSASLVPELAKLTGLLVVREG